MRVSIIGSGFSGLSCACFLAKEGHDVTVHEQNSTPGGRARKFEEGGFTFDMGPSWYWMPDVFEAFFQHFNKSSSDYYQLARLNPSYKIFYEKEILDVPAGLPELCSLFERLEPGSTSRLLKFIEDGKYKYELGIKNLVYKPGLSIFELFNASLLRGILRLNIFRSISSYIRQYFKNPLLIKLLEFPVLFLGASAQKTPAFYSLMNYADMALGTWYPRGGMSKVVDALVGLATELGVKFEFNSRVEQIVISGSHASSLTINHRNEECDYVVAAADYHHVEQNLLLPEYRNYSGQYWETRVLAPSCLIFFLGINKTLLNLAHHNLFFDQDFELHAKEIYDHPTWPTNPLFYVCCTSKSDTTVAPVGYENLFILIPVAPGLVDSDETRLRYFNLIIGRLEKLVGENILNHIVFNRSYAHRDFTVDYNAYKGNAYGLANTLFQTAHLKPSIQNKKVKNLFYTGQLTVPGPGVPPSLISGQVVARELMRQNELAQGVN
jgi:phytoene desaturase